MAEGITRSEILHLAQRAITVDRAATHGDAENNFARIASYWSAHLDCTVTALDVAVMMSLFKLARIKGNPSHIDSFTDAVGYAAIAGEIGAKQAAAIVTDAAKERGRYRG